MAACAWGLAGPWCSMAAAAATATGFLQGVELVGKGCICVCLSSLAPNNPNGGAYHFSWIIVLQSDTCLNHIKSEV